MVNPLEEFFPGLQGTDYRITSPKDKTYNCVAWAAGDTQEWWWPDPEDTYWPEGIPRSVTLSSFQQAFASIGYIICTHANLEPQFEKVAIFGSAEGVPTHVARQLSDGRWTSKLGRSEDIEHALHEVAGVVYGWVRLIMKRPRSQQKPSPPQPG